MPELPPANHDRKAAEAAEAAEPMLRRYRLDALPATPWKNGGGHTRAIACWPMDAGLDDFGWRVSVAAIESDGPFSRFPGVDRQIVLLGGDGVRLHGDGIDHRLAVPLQPFAFDGDVAVDCTRLGGPSTDFNLMTRRGHWHAELTVLTQATRLRGAPHGLLLAAAGCWRVGVAPPLAAGDGLWWAEATGPAEVVPDDDPGARLIAVRLWPV